MWSAADTLNIVAVTKRVAVHCDSLYWGLFSIRKLKVCLCQCRVFIQFRLLEMWVVLSFMGLKQCFESVSIPGVPQLRLQSPAEPLPLPTPPPPAAA